MEAQAARQGSPRTCTGRKRSVMRASRHFFLWGWVYYRGQLIDRTSRLTAYFSRDSIDAISSVMRSKSNKWIRNDARTLLQVQEQNVLLPHAAGHDRHTSKRAQAVKVLDLLTYNCRTLGSTQARLTEIAEDLARCGIHAAGLQGTCWRQTDPRSEWTVADRQGKPLFICFSSNKPTSNAHLGVLLLLSVRQFKLEEVRLRIDPSKHNKARMGGVRLVDRSPHSEQDHTFIVAYAPTEDSAEATKQHFFSELHHHVASLPARTNVWVLGDFTAHVGLGVVRWDLAIPKSRTKMECTLLAFAVAMGFFWRTAFILQGTHGGVHLEKLRTGLTTSWRATVTAEAKVQS